MVQVPPWGWSVIPEFRTAAAPNAMLITLFELLQRTSPFRAAFTGTASPLDAPTVATPGADGVRSGWAGGAACVTATVPETGTGVARSWVSVTGPETGTAVARSWVSVTGPETGT